ncbi:MAG TPA: molybdopterin-dependent oxidoreductase [Anaerolineae bacterium]|nr:molybdopterin-dependent oxidoreductase [Anaerolineae bacterium]
MFNRMLNRRDDEKRKSSENRLPPGQSLTQKFPVLHYGPTPQYKTLDNWDLRVFGLVEEEVTWTWEEFNALPRYEVTLDIHCVTRWSKFDTKWSGVSLRTLIDEGFIKPKPEAKFVVQHCEFGFTTNTPLDFLLYENVILATHYDGKPLTPEHGYPLRVVVGTFADRSEKESKYFWKGGKWLRGLEFRAEDQLGFWEKGGYSNEADPWREQRFSSRNWMDNIY